jgi:hypothetical protein
MGLTMFINSLRTYIGLLRESSVLSYLNTILSLPSSDSDKHEFKLVSLEPHHKDGGVFVHFRYSVPSGSSELADDRALQDVTATILEQINKNGGIMKWTGLGRSDIWSVKGRPWREVGVFVHSSRLEQCSSPLHATGYSIMIKRD